MGFKIINIYLLQTNKIPWECFKVWNDFIILLFYKTKVQNWDNKTTEWNKQGNFGAKEISLNPKEHHYKSNNLGRARSRIDDGWK